LGILIEGIAAAMQEVSHSDIYHKLGTLEGKMDSLIARVTEYNDDLKIAFDRIRSLERRQAWTMGAAAIISIAMPLLIQFVESELKDYRSSSVVEHQHLR
jgi:hypothetical protein